MKKPTFTPYQARDGWRCRLGLHRWKPVYRRVLTTWEYWTGDPFGVDWLDWLWHRVGRKCSRCGKRA